MASQIYASRRQLAEENGCHPRTIARREKEMRTLIPEVFDLERDFRNHHIRITAFNYFVNHRGQLLVDPSLAPPFKR